MFALDIGGAGRLDSDHPLRSPDSIPPNDELAQVASMPVSYGRTMTAQRAQDYCSSCSADISFEPLIEKVTQRKDAILGLFCAALETERCTVNWEAFHRGSFNLVYIATSSATDRKAIIRIPHPKRFDAVRFEADIKVLALIHFKCQSKVPAPEILSWSATDNNEVGMPFMMTSFCEGVSLSNVWFESTTTDANRAHILRQVAKAMVELDRTEFEWPEIGDLVVDPVSKALVLGPIRHINAPQDPDDFDDPELAAIESQPIGPFSRATDFHNRQLDHIDKVYPKDPWNPVYRMMVAILSDRELDGAPFGLSHPDLDIQNIFVDPETCDLTGIIDWDHISRTRPRAHGCSRFPAWTYREWDPLLYGYDQLLQSGEPGEPSTADSGFTENMANPAPSNGLIFADDASDISTSSTSAVTADPCLDYDVVPTPDSVPLDSGPSTEVTNSVSSLSTTTSGSPYSHSTKLSSGPDYRRDSKAIEDDVGILAPGSRKADIGALIAVDIVANGDMDPAVKERAIGAACGKDNTDNEDSTRDADSEVSTCHHPELTQQTDCKVSGVVRQFIPPQESPEKLAEYRRIYLEAIRERKPSLVAATQDSHIAQTLDTGLRCAIPRGGIGFKLADYVFGSKFLNCFDMPLAIRDGQYYREREARRLKKPQ